MAVKANGPQASRANGINKLEAVRRALDELGPDATPSELQPFIKQKFGITMTTDHISTSKSAIRRQAADKGKPTPAKAAAAPKLAVTKPHAVANQNKRAAANGITKMDGVKRALADLGPDAKPLAIKDYVKSHFGIEISTDVVSVYKRTLAHKAKDGETSGANKGKPAAPKPQLQPAKAPVATKTTLSPAAPKVESVKPAAGGVSLLDIGVVKDLMDRVGADSLRTLIDLLAK
jgi:hypothetical protein